MALRFSDDGLQLANASISVYIGRQLVDSDDSGAIAASVATVSTSAAQNELACCFSILSSSADLADGSALSSATFGSLITGGAKDMATVGMAIEALRESKMKGRASNANPRYPIVPSEAERVARGFVSELWTGIHIPAGTILDMVQVVGVSTDYLGS